MHIDQHKADLTNLRDALKRRDTANAVLALCLLVTGATLFKTVGSERTVVTPPTIEKSFWVEGEKVSREYLEQMAGYVAWLVLDASPATARWKRQAFLNWVSPDQYEAMRIKMELEEDRLRSLNAATSFLIQQLTPDPDQLSVQIVGRLRRQINGADVGEPETRTYIVSFNFKGGRMHIHGFKEIDHAQTAPTGAAAGTAVAQ